MAEVPHNAKDNGLKLILHEPELFVEFLRDFVPVEILKDVEPKDVEDLTERFLPLFQDSKDSDTVKKVTLKGDTPLFVIAIIEHESQVNYRASFKMLQYISLVLHEYEKEANKENPNASAAKGFKYPPVLPVVFYDGAGEWTAETNFLNRTELSGAFEKYIPKFEYELVNLNKYDEQAIVSFGDTLSLIMIIDKIRTADGIGILGKLPEGYIDRLKESIPPRLYKVLADVVTVFLTRINVPRDEIDKVTEKLDQRRLQEMFTFIDNYDVQETRREARAEGIAEGRVEGIAEGRVEGKAEGRAEGLIAVAKNLLETGDSIEKISQVTGLPTEEIIRLRAAN